MISLLRDEEQLSESIVEIFVFGIRNGYGFFVAPNEILTCSHVIFGDDSLKDVSASDIEIHRGGNRLIARIMSIDKAENEEDLALLSVEVKDPQGYLSLNYDVCSLEDLHIHGHSALTAIGFAGDAEKIMLLKTDGDIIEDGDSGAPLYNPRTRSVCGLIDGGVHSLNEVTAIHIKNVVKCFPKLANKQNDVLNLSLNYCKVFIVYHENDKALFNMFVQWLRDTNLTGLALYWKGEYEVTWSNSPPKTLEMAQVIILLVSSIPEVSDDYYKNYVGLTEERYDSGDIRVYQILPSNVSPIKGWPGQKLTFEEIARVFQEIICH